MHKEPKEYFLDKLEEQIFEMEAQLDDLEIRMEDAGWDPDIDNRIQIDGLRLRLRSLVEDVDGYEAASDTTWDKFKENCGRTLDEAAKEAKKIIDDMDKVLLE